MQKLVQLIVAYFSFVEGQLTVRMVSIEKNSFKLIVQLYKKFENKYKIAKTVPSDQRKHLKVNKKEE